jgi:hypothetical protein
MKKTIPDWNLLATADMEALFPGAQILEERRFGICKSLIAVKR